MMKKDGLILKMTIKNLGKPALMTLISVQMQWGLEKEGIRSFYTERLIKFVCENYEFMLV